MPPDLREDHFRSGDEGWKGEGHTLRIGDLRLGDEQPSKSDKGPEATLERVSLNAGNDTEKEASPVKVTKSNGHERSIEEGDKEAPKVGIDTLDNKAEPVDGERQGRKLLSTFSKMTDDDDSESSESDFELHDQENNSKRFRRSVRYAAFLEHRLNYLENAIKDLQKEDAETPNKKSKDKVNHIPAISYLEWPDFEIKPHIREPGKKWQHGDVVDTTPHSILEVLLEEPKMIIRRLTEGLKQNLDITKITANAVPKSKYPSTVEPIRDSPRTPTRVRIRSPLLMKILRKFSPKRAIGQGDKNLVTMLYPFKLLVTKAEQIGELLRELECKHQEKASSTNDNDTGTSEVQGQSDTRELDQPRHNIESQLSNVRTGSRSVEGESVEDTKSYEALQHLRILMKFMNDDLRHIWELREKIKNRTLQKIAFYDLWHLFEHAQLIRTPDDKDVQVYRIWGFTGGRDPINWEAIPDEDTAARKYDNHSQGAFCVQSYSIDFNGTRYAPKDTVFFIRKYEGEKEINTLSCFPLSFDPRSEELREQLLKRGITFGKLSGRNSATFRHKRYRGLTVHKEPEQVDSEVIIDFQWAYLRNPAWRPSLGFTTGWVHDVREITFGLASQGACGQQGCCGNDHIYWDYEIDDDAHHNFLKRYQDTLDQVDSVDDLLGDESILLPYTVYGFILRSRKWAPFAIDQLSEINYNADGWSNLELPEGHKDTVFALVENHADGSSSKKSTDTFAAMDLVKGKGKGLIILLHGEPGVGKTSTAECVAERTRRPLFSITCGDIGDNAYMVEENLEHNFQLAHRWGCVLLLDEADVFLQRRSMEDLARNSIVSVFLRTLEYYSGILFLTTNRVGKLDPAFKSRIHLSLFYPRLDRATTVKIWKNHITRIKRQIKQEKRDFEIDQKDILNYSRSHFDELRRKKRAPWNGRQIRNAFQTAMALAEYSASSPMFSNSRPRLSRMQFERVAKTSLEFDAYLQIVWGGRDDAEVAEKDQARNDEVTMEMLREYNLPTPTVMPAERKPDKTTSTKRATTAVKPSAPQRQYEEGPSEHPSDDDDDDDDDDDLGSEDDGNKAT